MKKILALLLLSLIFAASASATDYKIAIVPFNFQNDTSGPPLVNIQQDLINSPSNPFAFWNKVSYGQWNLIPTLYNYTTIPFNNESNGNCPETQWSASAKSILISQGEDLSQYYRFVYVFPFANCPYGGIALGNGAYLNGHNQPDVAAHELGHTFGLHHAHAFYCTDNSGAVYAWFSSTINCVEWEYGDSFDVMGNGYGQVNSVYRGYLGLFPESRVKAVSSSGRYNLSDLQLYSAPNPQMLKIDRGPDRRILGEFSVEYRPSAGGVIIRWYVQGGNSGLEDTKLLDMTPGSTAVSYPMYDAPLGVGKTFWDSTAKISITLVSIDASAATVDVKYKVNKKPIGAIT